MNELTTITPHEVRPADNYRTSTDAASICRDIVVATASTIQGRKFVSVEGWQAIAIAHGCAAGARDVERVEGGVRAIGEVRRMQDGQLIATAEGFVGEDEPTWYGGQSRGKTLPKRADYAIRAMAQTRAVSRACRSAFAHVVVMMNANLSTTPAEEVPAGGFDNTPHNPQTGEVIEARVGPEPRSKLDGPHTSKTALKKAIHEISEKVRVATSVAEVNAAMKGTKPTMDQAERDFPELLHGDPALEGDDVGLVGLVTRRRTELTPPAATELYRQLVDSLNQVDTEAQVQGFLTIHGDAMDGLDGEESRTFERLFNERASIIKSGKVPLIPANA